ncbi:hypothetical protein [Haloarchaeobius sp. TZWWS8]|uniref:hypothetical protein n=1 Tax=Haloarchaeobius sp. TZWWS8 TaxID=3446121 RepID=UPI003EBC91EB
MSEHSLADFFEENSHLFTVMGVFGAISVYFTQLTVDSRWSRLGIVSSLTIFLLVALTIQKRVSPPSSERNTFDFLVNSQWKRSKHILFYVAFWSVVVSITAIVLEFSNTFLFLFQFVCFLLGVGTARWWVGRGSQEGPVTLGRDSEAPEFLGYVMKGGVENIAIGGGLLSLLWNLELLPINLILNFKSHSLFLSIAIGILSGMLFAGVLYTFTYLMAFATHFFLSSIPDEELEKIRDSIYSDASETE